LEEEADHLAAGIWPACVGIGSRRAAADLQLRLALLLRICIATASFSWAVASSCAFGSFACRRGSERAHRSDRHPAGPPRRQQHLEMGRRGGGGAP
jgi:hypothetical protein